MIAADGMLGRQEWVLARPLYRFARIDMRTVPAAARARALDLQIRQESPFPRTGSYVAWENDEALVWSWSADQVEAAVSEKGLKKSIPVIPETLLHPRQSGGAHLVASLEGFEGQLWKESMLVASRWWPQEPTSAEWRNFQKDGGVLPEEQQDHVPQPVPPEWSDRPWVKADSAESFGFAGPQREKWIVTAVAMCLVAMTFWYGAQIVKIRSATSNVATQLRELDQRAGPVLAARAEALEALDRIKSLQAAIDRYPDQATLMSRVSQALSAEGAYLKQWEFASGKLNVQVVSAREMASSEWIKRFEALGLFRNVQAKPENDPKVLSLSMETLPPADLRVASAASGNPR